jgi:hypothetical protein
MKRAVVYGDMSSDSTSENYPTITLCEDCIAKDAARKEDSQVVSIDGEAEPEDGPCEWCGAETD